MAIKRPFFVLFQLFNGLSLAFTFLLKGIFSIPVRTTWLIAIWSVVVIFMAISHFKERRLPYFYPSLFMYFAAALLIGWGYYNGGK